MKNIFITLISLLVLIPLSAQSLSDLTPEQIELYKKYKEQTSPVSTNNVEEKVSQDRTMVDEISESKKDKENELDNKNNGKFSNDLTRKQKVQMDSLKNEEDFKIIYDEENGKYIKVRKDIPPALEIFGSKLFSTQDLTFEPKLNIPTPPNYILGTYDEMIIDMTGLYEANYRVKVSPDGFIRIPAVGLVKVSGQTIEAASSNIKNRLSRVYSGMSSGETQVRISLGNIRSIRVTVVGEAFRPGSYTLPSLATAFNALYACGGPGKMGSMRDIKVIRHGKVIANIDMYRFLIDGMVSGNISLQDEDVIKIEPYQNRVTIKGAVKHVAIFEALKGEKLKDLIRFAGGFTENAHRATITVFRLTSKEKMVVDVKENEIPSFEMQSGDVYTVTKTYEKFENRVDITGSVFRPGAYALELGLTIRKLIAKADGVKEDAYLNMATIIRKKENQIPEILSFNLGEVLYGISPDILLQKDDSVRISNLFDFREKEMVSIWGAVKKPGTYKLIENITIKDLVFKAKGFKEMASTDSVELIRIIKDPQMLKETDVKTIVKKFKLDKNLNFKDGEGDFLLQNGDQVIVRTIPGYEDVRMVRIDGEVLQPGKYNIINKTERISDLVRRAGGFTNYAYPLGAYLIRYEKTSGVENILKQKMVDNAKRQLESKSTKEIDVNLLKETGSNDIDDVKEKLSGTKSVDQILDSEGIVGINLKEIMKHPGSSQDLYLEESDVIYVPRELQTVRVLGEVLFPTYVGYEKGLSLRDYVSSAGGFSNRAQRSRTFVLYANGTAKSTSSFLGIKHYPPIRPGSHIVVPEKPTELKNKMSTAETVSILGSLVTVATLVISVLR
ncbi:MAG: SLBB domain-containing protein [Bacteroidales bacterium]|nr:SLBB domain-containing protein [Bacteroidales bacterium]